MKLNKKLVAIGLVLLIMLWTGNIIYYKKHVIKEPLFIKHYYDVYIKGDIVNLYYLQSTTSKDKIINITFPEIEQKYIEFTENDIDNSKGPYYRLKALNINVNNGSNNEVSDEYTNKVITRANIAFSSGKTMNVNLGEIHLYNSDKNKTSYLKREMQSSSSDNTGGTTFYADKDIYITGINNRFYNDIKDILEVSIDGTKISDVKFPIELDAEQSINIAYAFKFSNKNDIRLNNAYHLVFNLSTEDSRGNKGSTPCFIDFYPSSSDNLNINALKNNKGVE